MKKPILLLLVLLFVSCTPKKWVLTNYSTSKISIDATLDKISDKSMSDFIAPYKINLDKEMNIVVGESAEEMRAGKPESLLSNWNADLYREAGSDFLKQPVDIGIVNLGGLRTALPKGKLRVKNVFELMPFENELVLLWLKGSELKKLADIFAIEGGQGVSGIRFEIKDRKAQNITINGEPLDVTKNYSIATNDYLAGGNDKMTPLANHVKKLETGLKLRNIIMEKIIRENRNGKKIQSKLDGRIKIL